MMVSAPTITHHISRRWPRWSVVALILAALLVGILPAPTALAAASCVVSSTGDSGANTLRQCLADVDSGGAITFNLPNPSTITLTSGALSLDKSVTITGPGATSLAISGNNASRVFFINAGTVNISGLTVTGGNDPDCENNSGGGGISILGAATVTIDESAITGNRCITNGGGIGIFHANASLALTDSTVSNNVGGYGGGLFVVGGTVTLTNTTVSGNSNLYFSSTGGGLDLRGGTTRLVNSTVSGNTSRDSGGGIATSFTADLMIENSTVSDNTTEDGSGGGLELRASGETTITGSTISGNRATGLHSIGGGILVFESGPVLIANSTISGNSTTISGGGVYVVSGMQVLRTAATDGVANDDTLLALSALATLRAVTVTGNVADSDGNASGDGGGLAGDEGDFLTYDVLGSIVAGNRRGAATVDDCFGTIVSRGHNLWGNNTTCPADGTADQNLTTLGKTIGQVLTTTLAENSGTTKTHALVTGSPAIDHGDNTACAAAPISGKDQRGVTRPVGASCDIGAFEGVGPETPQNPGCAGFSDVAEDDPACPAIEELTERGVIKGYDTNPPRFGPGDDVQRAQVAVFIVRLLQWQNEPTTPKNFTDFGTLVGELKTASLILANTCDNDGHCVAEGYQPAGCIAHNKQSPCFGPNDQVSYAQVISFIARAFQFDETFGWEPQPNGALPYTGIPAVHQPDVKIYHHYAGTIPDAPTTAADWSKPASRAWIAMVLYQALLTIAN